MRADFASERILGQISDCVDETIASMGLDKTIYGYYQNKIFHISILSLSHSPDTNGEIHEKVKEVLNTFHGDNFKTIDFLVEKIKVVFGGKESKNFTQISLITK